MPDHIPDISGISWLLISITKPLAGFWWFGPLLMAFTWIAVPVMRARHPVLGVSDYSSTTRFWWAPGWGYWGITGFGLSLVAGPLLVPQVAASWQPFAWPGFTANLSINEAALMVAVGVLMAFKGIELYLHALHRDRTMRYMAWRWRNGAPPPGQDHEPEQGPGDQNT